MSNWKKTRDDKYRTTWLHKNKKIGVSVEVGEDDPYIVYYGNINNAFGKSFKTKPQALAFAKAYMSKN